MGKRLYAVYTPETVPEHRAQAQRELRVLRQCVRRYHAPPRGLAGRPSKLTPDERAQMSDEHDALRVLMRQHAGSESPTPQQLDQIFQAADFVRVLLKDFPPGNRSRVAPWKTFLKTIWMSSLSERCVRYLAFEYGVSKDTIKRAIWPRKNPQ